jgi:EAL domain-containing protein (putative c-di-GMP-specific phosphodiesterase class I)
VRAISGLGRSLNISTTAEGVETMDQLDTLRAEGCTEVQGFLFSAARPADDIRALLEKFGERASRAA